MIINNLDLFSARMPLKAKSKLVIDPYAQLARAVASKALEPISGRTPEVI